MSVVTVDLLALASNANYFNTLSATNASEPAISLLSYDQEFQSTVLGSNVTARKLADLDWQAFHEGGLYHKDTNELYVSSNYINLQDNINITVINLTDYSIKSTQFPNLYEANGGSTYYPPGSNMSQPPPNQIWCDEGDFQHPSSLVSVDIASNKSEVILTSFLGGKNFSSVNDVRQHPYTGDLWFTDAAYGYFQNFRPAPEVPQQVYRFEPDTGVLQVVADGFVQPNGIEFSPDYKTVYITDTGAQEFGQNFTRPATIYAYDVDMPNNRTISGRRTFAYVDTGFPDGIHADTDGNVWAGCGDGVHVWNSAGKLLGKVFVGETSNNFAFAPGKLFVFTNYRLWVVEGIKSVGREVCKDFQELC